MAKTINLSELFSNNFDCYTTAFVNWREVDEPALSREKFLELTKEAIRQVLELASENARRSYTDSMIGGCPECYCDGVDKESITNTINQIV